MSDPIQIMQSDLNQPRPDGLWEGNLFVELQVPSWPPAVTQTLLRNRDGRLSLTIRAKPSGRLRVELVRAGYGPLIVRTVHLRLHTPGLLRLNVAWRGDAAVVAAGGQIIGSSTEAIPEGVASPETLEETMAPLDHVDNDRARAERRRRADVFLQGREVGDLQLRRWIAALDDTARSLNDLSKLVQQQHYHHLSGMVDALVRLLCGDGALLQWCAGMLDAPLIVYVPSTPPQAGPPAALLAAAFDVAAARGTRHALAVDIDVWLRHEQTGLAARPLPVEALLLAISATLAPRPDHVDSEDDRLIRGCLRQPQVIATLCAFATAICGMAAAAVAAATGENASRQHEEPEPCSVGSFASS
jgi:hypothetical protein